MVFRTSDKVCQGPGAGFAQPGCLVNKELFGLTSIPGSPMETGSESPGDEASRDKIVKIYIYFKVTAV